MHEFDQALSAAGYITNEDVRRLVREVKQDQYTDWSKGPTPPAIMEVSESTYDTSGSMQRLQANIEWWNQNFDRLQQDSSLYNSYIAISDGAVFSADSYLDVYNKTREV